MINGVLRFLLATGMGCCLAAQSSDIISQPVDQYYNYFYDEKNHSIFLKTPRHIFNIWKVRKSDIQSFQVLARIQNRIDYIYRLKFEQGHGVYEFFVVNLKSGKMKKVDIASNDYLGKFNNEILFFLGGIDIKNHIQEGVVAIKIPSLKRIVLAPELIVDKDSFKIEDDILCFSGNDEKGQIVKRQYSIRKDL